MGIPNFTHVFQNSGEFKYKDFKDKNVVIDASVEIYRASLGMNKSEVLTDSSGNPTAHINVILLGVILKLKAAGASQYWVFDHNQQKDVEFHNPYKQLELQKRKDKRNIANEKLNKLKQEFDELKNNVNKEDELFSDSESNDSDSSVDKKSDKKSDNIINDKLSKMAICQNNIDKQEKRAHSISKSAISDVIFMLNMLDIPWVECPAGFEAEQLAAFSTYNKKILGHYMDYILTPDVDALLFGGKCLIKRDTRKKKLFKYDLYKLLDDYTLTQDELIKIGIILGTDFAPKTPRIGEKTVLKKYKDVVLSDEQNIAFNCIFKRKLTDVEIDNIVVNNVDNEPFIDMEKYKSLLDWLESVKSFNRERIMKQFAKQKLFD